MGLKPSTKALIVASLTVVINFFTYFFYPRIFGFAEVTIPQSLGFVIFESFFHFVIIGSVSFILFKNFKWLG